MRIDRLKLLSKKLRTVPKERFDMSFWKCGTTCCAFGWACTIPEFKEAGLHFEDCYPVDGNGDTWWPEDFFELDEATGEDRPIFYDFDVDDPNVIADRIDALIAKAEKA